MERSGRVDCSGGLLADQPSPPRSAYRTTLVDTDWYSITALKSCYTSPGSRSLNCDVRRCSCSHDAAWPSSHRRGRTRSYPRAKRDRAAMRARAKPFRNAHCSSGENGRRNCHRGYKADLIRYAFRALRSHALVLVSGMLSSSPLRARPKRASLKSP